MASAWLVQQRSGKSGWVDVTWSLRRRRRCLCRGDCAARTGAMAALAADRRGGARRVLVPAARAAHCRAQPHDRGRSALSQLDHAMGRRRAAADVLVPAVAGGGRDVLALSIALAAHNPNPALRFRTCSASALLIGAIVGEAIADRQLRQFKADPANRKAVCDVGLWRWSRHPNYFFEWLSWVGYPVIAIDFAGYNPYGWLALAAPACMYWVLVHVSGIPPLEASHAPLARRSIPRLSAADPAVLPVLPKFLTASVRGDELGHHPET